MKEKLTAHAFSIKSADGSQKLADLLGLIKSTPFKNRLRIINTGQYRADLADEVEPGVWFVDFGKLREGHGPGAASKTTPTRGLVFVNGEHFCEETGCLIDTNKMFMVAQFNFDGARAGTMSEYLSCFNTAVTNSYFLTPKYDDEVLRKYENRTATKNVEFAIDSREFTAEDKKEGKSLTHALSMADEADGSIIKMKISAGISKKKVLNKTAEKLISFLRKKSVENPHAVTTLKVGYLSEFDAKVEIADLIAHRLSVTFKDLALGADNRISSAERLLALHKAYISWKGKF